MRLNLRSSTWASVAMSSVFARPGTPTIRLLPPTKSVSSTSSMTSLCPTIFFWSSAMICLRPSFILSASATSSADSRPELSRFKSNGRLPMSMRHSVHDVVHAELVRLVRLFDRPEARRGEFPEVRDVRAVVDDHHQPLLRIVVFEEAEELRLFPIVGLRN